MLSKIEWDRVYPAKPLEFNGEWATREGYVKGRGKQLRERIEFWTKQNNRGMVEEERKALEALKVLAKTHGISDDF